MNGGLSSSPGLGPFSLSWRLESARGKPVVDVQRIVDVASLVSGASRSWRSELDKRIVLITEQTLSSSMVLDRVGPDIHHFAYERLDPFSAILG
jgi:hypothetical protein